MANKHSFLRQRWLQWVSIHREYMKRMPLIPRNPWFNVYLHRYSGPDNRDEGLHDHPWHSLSIRLWGRQLRELRHFKGVSGPIRNQRPGGVTAIELPRVVWRKATDAHAICSGSWPVWTLFITGPRIRDWGFYTRKGWRPAQDVIAARFTKTADGYEHGGDGTKIDRKEWSNG